MIVGVLALAGHPLIPYDDVIDLALACLILAVDVCKYQICVPVVQRAQVCLEIEGEGQHVLVVVAVIQEGVEFPDLHRLLNDRLPGMLACPGVRGEEVECGQDCEGDQRVEGYGV